MKNQILSLSIPLDALASAIAAQLLPVLQGVNAQMLPSQKEKEKYLTRKETAKTLNVSLPTLTQYTKSGKIAGYRFGTRVLYKESELVNALQKIKGGGNG